MKQFIELIKSKIPWDAIKTHPSVVRLIDMYEALPPDRKKLVLIGGGFGIFLIGYLCFSSGFGYLESLESETKIKQNKLLVLALDYDDLLTENKVQIDSINRRLDASKQWIPADYLKEVFSASGVTQASIKKLEDSPKRFIGSTQEVASQVELINLTLLQLTQVLRALNTPSKPLTIKNMAVQSISGQESLLNVSLNIHSFRKRK